MGDQMMLEDAAIPQISLSGARNNVASSIRAACENVGFFVICDHGVPKELLDRTYDFSKRFFDLTTEEKATIQVQDNRGWTPMESEILDPANQKKGDTKEGIYIGREPEPFELGQPLRAQNIWPDEEKLPVLKGFRQTMTEYFTKMTELGLNLLDLIARSLELDDASYFHQYFTHPLNVLRLLHYSSEVSSPAGQVFGCGAHSDYGMLTLLSTDSVPGLEIYKEGKWFAVNPQPCNFVVNLGDMLERWTNGKFKSTVHRVVNREGRERYSIPFFFEPNFDTLVKVLPQCIDKGESAKYPPITSGQFVLDKYAQTHVWMADKDDALK